MLKKSGKNSIIFSLVSTLLFQNFVLDKSVFGHANTVDNNNVAAPNRDQGNLVPLLRHRTYIDELNDRAARAEDKIMQLCSQIVQVTHAQVDEYQNTRMMIKKLLSSPPNLGHDALNQELNRNLMDLLRHIKQPALFLDNPYSIAYSRENGDLSVPQIDDLINRINGVQSLIRRFQEISKLSPIDMKLEIIKVKYQDYIAELRNIKVQEDKYLPEVVPKILPQVEMHILPHKEKGNYFITNDMALRLLSVDPHGISVNNAMATLPVVGLDNSGDRRDITHKAERDGCVIYFKSDPNIDNFPLLSPTMENAAYWFYHLAFAEGVTPSSLVVLNNVLLDPLKFDPHKDPIIGTYYLDYVNNKLDPAPDRGKFLKYLHRNLNHNRYNAYKNIINNFFGNDLRNRFKSYLVQASKAVKEKETPKGDKPISALVDALNRINTVETDTKYSVCLHSINNMIMMAGDAKADNFILEDKTNKIIGIDNDRFLVPDIYMDSGKNHFVGLRSVFYCAPQLLNLILPEGLIKIIKATLPHELIKKWLNKLEKYDRYYQNCNQLQILKDPWFDLPQGFNQDWVQNNPSLVNNGMGNAVLSEIDSGFRSVSALFPIHFPINSILSMRERIEKLVEIVNNNDFYIFNDNVYTLPLFTILDEIKSHIIQKYKFHNRNRGNVLDVMHIYSNCINTSYEGIGLRGRGIISNIRQEGNIQYGDIIISDNIRNAVNLVQTINSLVVRPNPIIIPNPDPEIIPDPNPVLGGPQQPEDPWHHLIYHRLREKALSLRPIYNNKILQLGVVGVALTGGAKYISYSLYPYVNHYAVTGDLVHSSQGKWWPESYSSVFLDKPLFLGCQELENSISSQVLVAYRSIFGHYTDISHIIHEIQIPNSSLNSICLKANSLEAEEIFDALVKNPNNNVKNLYLDISESSDNLMLKLEQLIILSNTLEKINLRLPSFDEGVLDKFYWAVKNKINMQQFFINHNAFSEVIAKGLEFKEIVMNMPINTVQKKILYMAFKGQKNELTKMDFKAGIDKEGMEIIAPLIGHGLKELILENNPLEPFGGMILASVLSNASNLEHLNLNNCKIDQNNMNILLEYIKSFNKLKALYLSSNQITDNEVKLLSSLYNLNYLNLNENSIGETGIKYLASLSSLKSLYLNWNKIGDIGAQHLSSLSNLTYLDLVGNIIESKGAQSISLIPSLTSLDLCWNKIGDMGVQYISSLSKLTYLGLAGNNIGDTGAQHISSLSNLTSLTLLKNQIGPKGAQHLSFLSNLSYINLNENSIGDSGAQHLSSFPRLTYLYLSWNNIGDTGINYLSSLSTLVCLELVGNTIESKGAQSISLIPGLTSLDLSWNKIGSKGTQYLASLSKLASLNLAGNNIGDTGALHLSVLANLTSLNLLRNQIGSIGAQYLSSLNNLTYLNLNENSIGDLGVQHLFSLTNLTYLSLNSNQIGEAMKEKLRAMNIKDLQL